MTLGKHPGQVSFFNRMSRLRPRALPAHSRALESLEKSISRWGQLVGLYLSNATRTLVLCIQCPHNEADGSHCHQNAKQKDLSGSHLCAQFPSVPLLIKRVRRPSIWANEGLNQMPKGDACQSIFVISTKMDTKRPVWPLCRLFEAGGGRFGTLRGLQPKSDLSHRWDGLTYQH